jgi:ABC-type Fe3+-hydroxamate transport system substrate-binding protein
LLFVIIPSRDAEGAAKKRMASAYKRCIYFYNMMLFSSAPLPYQPKRIISLVPSQTELLYDLGLGEYVVGITKFCVHPAEWRKTKTIIGGTKNIHQERIKALQPDLIIANKEENVKEQVETLAKEFNVFVTDIATLEGSLQMINDIGILTHTSAKADEIIHAIKENFSNLTPSKKIKTAYFIWRNPYMTIGGDTFINDMLAKCGFDNIFSSQTRYPAIDINELKEKGCELLLLSSEPYPFKQKHIDELQQVLPETKIMLVDGEMFSWYGSRLIQAPAYFKRLLKEFI